MINLIRPEKRIPSIVAVTLLAIDSLSSNTPVTTLLDAGVGGLTFRAMIAIFMFVIAYWLFKNEV